MADKPLERAKEAVAAGVESTSEALGEGLDAAREKFEDVSDDLDRRYRRAARDMRKMGDAAREKYESAKEGVREAYAKARKDFERLGNDVTDYVRDNPGKALLIAAGVGFLVGLAVRRRSDD